MNAAVNVVLTIVLILVLALAMTLMATACQAGQVSLEWDSPTQNEDGSPLVDLAGFYVYYVPVSLTRTQLNNNEPQWEVSGTNGTPERVWSDAARTTLQLPSKTYSFWVTAVASYGSESEPSSNVVHKVGSPRKATNIKVKF